MNRLEPILAATREQVERRALEVPFAAVRAAAEDRAAQRGSRDLTAALRAPGLALIAEHKRRSPSAGTIRDDVSLESVVSAYERGGAAALSVLTDAPSFGGSLDDLRAARVASALPILRKDFILTSYQVHESLAAGADAILLIVAALAQGELLELHAEARALGLAVLVEIHDREELRRAAAAGPDLVGINNRDLTTLEVNLARTFELLPELPDGVLAVAESGFRSPAELRGLRDAGVDAVLVGESLMRSADIEAACRALSVL